MVSVDSEIGVLKKVLIHRPDIGIGRISPRRAEELLFDDIVYVPQMIKEHDTFVEVLRTFIGNDGVLEISDLVIEALYSSDDAKSKLVSRIIDFEELPTRDFDILYNFSNEKLAKVLISGYEHEENRIFFDPIPNFIFTRDIAVAVNDHIIVTKAAKEARQRENILTRFIFYYHPMFKDLRKDDRVINLNDIDLFPPSPKGERVSVEGGDMMLLDKDFLLIGASERTTSYAIESIKNCLFAKGVVKNIVQINIPNERSFMHIDTLFTRINVRDIVCYKPIVFDGRGSNVEVFCQDGSYKVYDSVKNFVVDCIHPDMNFIFSGDGESPYQEREQWTDGCNLVALKPGIAITYDRNPKTEVAFKKAGYDVVHSVSLLENINNGVIRVQDVEKTIITLQSGELSRARGGSHCMTCPIVRDNIS